jgi:hypothetical protein
MAYGDQKKYRSRLNLSFPESDDKKRFLDWFLEPDEEHPDRAGAIADFIEHQADNGGAIYDMERGSKSDNQNVDIYFED